MSMKIQLSFKVTEKKMYEHVMRQLSPSIYIKQLIKDTMEQKPAKEPVKRNLLDF